MRSIAALIGGNGIWGYRPYFLALAALLSTTVQAAYQDAGALIELETGSDGRWKTTLVTSPYGSEHRAQVALPLSGDSPVIDQPVGLSLGSLGTPSDTLVLTPSGGTASASMAASAVASAAGPAAKMTAGPTISMHPDARPVYPADSVITGSISSSTTSSSTTSSMYPSATAPAFPEVVRETKGDLLMSRSSRPERFRIDPDAGGMIRVPPMIIEPPKEEEKALIQSFMKSDPPKNGRPIMVASLDPTAGLSHMIAFQPLLTSPLEEVWRGRIEIDNYDRDRHCLSTAIYFEARGEAEAGQRAVAQVVLNRVLDYRYPDTVCGVVFQNQNWRNRCQFSFACDGQPERISDKGSWSTAVRIAEEALDGDYFMESVGESTHYHATYVNPRWSRYLDKMDKIGTHIFYQLRPGQR